MRVLFVCSNPPWTSRLDLGDEMREIMHGLRGQDVDFMLLPAAQRMDLKRAIVGTPDIDVLHFSGHATRQEGIILRDEDGMEDPVEGTELKDLLEKNERPIKLTVLNACNTKSTATKIRGSVGAVLSTNKELDDEAARKMTRCLYSELSLGRSIEEACDTAKKTIKEAGFDDNVYELEGDDDKKAESVFDKPAAETGDDEASDKPTIRIENKPAYDKYFFINYIDEQMRDLERKRKFNRMAWGVLLFFGLVFLVSFLQRPGLWQELMHFVKVTILGKEFVDQYLKKPYLDTMMAIGATFPALISFFQRRLAIHAERELRSLRQMKELAKASDELPLELQERFGNILDQCIRGADTGDQSFGWFGLAGTPGESH